MGKAFDYACGRPWAITEEALGTILDVSLRVKDELTEGRIEAVEARLGRPLDNTHEVTTRDGVATIPVVGPIARYMDIFTRISGGTSVERLATDLQAAVDDGRVKAIVLSVDSPGGEANGTHEMARMVAAADKVKPVVAYVGGVGASGAYWLASAARKLVVNETSIVGSVGVVATLRKRDRPDEVKVVSSASPKKHLDPGSDEGRDEVQKTVDALADVFVSEVAAYRGVDRAKVLADFGRGGVLVGKAAVKAGMADEVGTYESVHAALAAGNYPERRKKPAPKPVKGPKMNMFERIGRLVTGAESDPAGGDHADPGEILSTAPLRPVVRAPYVDHGSAATPDPRVAELEARIKAHEQAALDGFGLQAQAAWDVLKAQGKVLPLAREDFLVAYVQAAADDASHGSCAGITVTDTGVTVSSTPDIRATRVARLRAAYSALGEHGFTKQGVVANGKLPEGLTPLSAHHDGDPLADPASPESAEARVRAAHKPSRVGAR